MTDKPNEPKKSLFGSLSEWKTLAKGAAEDIKKLSVETKSKIESTESFQKIKESAIEKTKQAKEAVEKKIKPSTGKNKDH